MINGLLITHNDMDAAGCAIVTNLLCTTEGERITWDIEYCSATGADDAFINLMNDIISNTYKYILIGDISISENMAVKLENICQENNIFISLYDHHISNKLYLNHSWCHVDTANSACWLMYDKLIKEKQSTFLSNIDNTAEKYLDWLLKSISKYDTWQWKTEPKEQSSYEDVSEGDLSDICKFIGVKEFVNDFYNFAIYGLPSTRPRQYIPQKLYYLIQYIHINKRNTINHIISSNNIKSITFGDKKCAVMISDSSDFIYANELLEILYKDEGADISMMIYPRTQVISVRTGRDDIDLSSFVKEYFGTGGGHQKAAGARLDIDTISKLTHQYYISEPWTFKKEDK